MQLFIHTTTTGSMRKMLFEFLLLIQKKEKSQFFWPIFWVLLSLARFSCLFLLNTWMNLDSFYEIPVKSHMQSYKSLVVYSFFFCFGAIYSIYSEGIFKNKPYGFGRFCALVCYHVCCFIPYFCSSYFPLKWAKHLHFNTSKIDDWKRHLPCSIFRLHDAAIAFASFESLHWCFAFVFVHCCLQSRVSYAFRSPLFQILHHRLLLD